MDAGFFRTRMGAQFYEGTMPCIAKSLERIAKALEQEDPPPVPPDLRGVYNAYVSLRDADPSEHTPAVDRFLKDVGPVMQILGDQSAQEKS